MKTVRRSLIIALCASILAAAVFPAAVPVHASSAESIRVGVAGGMAPLLFYGPEGQVQGAFADMMAYIAEQNNYSIEYIKYRQSIECLTALDCGEIDIALGISSEKAEGFPSIHMSRELYAASLCVAAEKEQLNYGADPYGAYEYDTVPYHLMRVLDINQLLILPNQKAVLDALLTGRACRIIGLRDCILYTLSEAGLDNAYSVSNTNVGYVSYGIALHEDFILNSRIDTTIAELRVDDQYDTILKKWKIQTEIEAANLRMARLIKVIAFVAAGAALVLLLFVAINRRLRTLVKAKTAELSEKVDDLELAGSLRNVLIERSSAGSMILRLDGTILLMNDAMRQLTGSADGQEISNVSELGFINDIWSQAPSEMDQPELYTERGNDGILHTYRYQNHRAVNHDERVFMIEDVTAEEMEKQEIFEESKNKALNRIISGIAHEIKNPLMTIKTYASLAQAQGSDPEFLGAFTEYVPKEVDRITRLVETLVNYSRPVHGQKERFCVAEVADSCLGLALVTAKKSIKVENEIDRSLYISTNKDQFRQALINFLINSIESNEAKLNSGKSDSGLVKLSVYRVGNDVCTEVYDTGVGMNKEQLQQCAEPFFTTKKQGTGMGLALAKQYTKENGGRFEVESREGEYTSVRMIFAEDIKND